MFYCHHLVSEHTIFIVKMVPDIWLELFIDGRGRTGSLAMMVTHQSQASCPDTAGDRPAPRPHMSPESSQKS